MKGLRLRRLNLSLPSRHGDVAAIAFGDPGRPVDAIFLHANGYNAFTYRSILEPLGKQYHVIAVDQRGHGQTTLPADPHDRHDYSDLTQDLVALVEGLGAERVVLAGHSMGGTVCLLAAPTLADRVAGMVLVDPPMLLKADRDALSAMSHDDAMRHPMYRAAYARRAEFPTRAAAFAHYMGRGSFRTWHDQTLRDYVEDGFREQGGAMRLTCPPEWEACNFLAHDNPVWDAIAGMSVPITFLLPDAGEVCRIAHPDIPCTLPGTVRIERVPQSSHFLPMEYPELVSDRLAAAIEQAHDAATPPAASGS